MEVTSKVKVKDQRIKAAQPLNQHQLQLSLIRMTLGSLPAQMKECRRRWLVSEKI